MLSNFKVFVDTFRNPSLYPINAGIPSTSGVALGRYPEDIYYTGNPWYLITIGAAEFLYDAVAQWSKQGFISVDSDSLSFFQDLYPAAQADKTYKRCNKTSPFRQILNAATSYADSFVSVVQTYTPADGALAEQFLKTLPGTPLSAGDLTWSYAAFVGMARRRQGDFPPSWTNSATPPPATCSSGSVAGIYAPATAAGAPNVTIGCTSTVRFVLNATTYYGENIYLAGNSSDLGKWDLGNSLPMQSTNYTEARPLWFAEIPLTAGETISYKYVREEDCGQEWIWEERENRTLKVPDCVEGSTEVLLSTDEAWVGKGGRSGGC